MKQNKRDAHARLHEAGENCPLALNVVCTHVLRSIRPVLLAWHDGESVALACGKGDHHQGIDDWGMAHAFHYTGNDPALGIVRTLRPGQGVERERVGSRWFRVLVEDGEVVTRP